MMVQIPLLRNRLKVKLRLRFGDFFVRQRLRKLSDLLTGPFLRSYRIISIVDNIAKKLTIVVYSLRAPKR